MHSLPIYVVDAFTLQPYAGNPAAVCLLEHSLTDEYMFRVVPFL